MLNRILTIFQNYKGKTTERPHFLEGECLARYKFASQFIKSMEVLDIGTGLGEGAYYLALNGAKRVLGIDYSKIAIDYAKRNFSLVNLEFKVIDAINLSLPANSFDIIIAFEVIEHILPKYHQQFLNRIIQLLKSDGICLISTPNKLFWSPDRFKPYNPYHTKEFKPNEFADLLQRHFSEASLMGIKCVNKLFLQQQKKLSQSIKHRMLSFPGRYRIVRELLAFVPKKLKQKVTSEDRLPPLKASDFEISLNNVENCEGLMAVCRKERA